MTVKPIRDMLVVIKEETATKTPSGIYLPQTKEENICFGSVSRVGSGKVTQSGTVVPMEVRAGDRIAFDKRAAVELKVGNETFLLLREENVLCVLK